jgi:phosphohistidine phosphatase
MSTTGRTLLVMRHAKSAYPEDTPDFDRPLAPRGLRAAVSLGAWIRDQGLAPDLAVCSTAARARQTWDVVRDQLASYQLAGEDEDGEMVRYDPRLYQAGPGDLIEVIQETPPEVAILAVVGHNPAVAGLVHVLTADTGPAAHAAASFPTAALAVIGVRRAWGRAGPGCGSLDGYWTPKGGSALPPG